MEPGAEERTGVALDERGFTFPELIIAMGMALITATVAMTILSSLVKSQPEVNERAAQLQTGRAMVERLTQELRQAETVYNATTSSIEFLTYVDAASCGGAASTAATLCRVSYSCSGSTCYRWERNPDGTGSGPTEQITNELLDPGIFTYSPSTADPSYVGVRLAFPASDGSEAVTLRDGASLRNHFEEEAPA